MSSRRDGDDIDNSLALNEQRLVEVIHGGTDVARKEQQVLADAR